MGGNAQRSPSSTITGINVTPLVDITLVLLIIFMVTAKLIVSPKALQVELPKASTGSEAQEIFSVVLFEDGRTHVNGTQLVDENEVMDLAKAVKDKNKELRA